MDLLDVDRNSAVVSYSSCDADVSFLHASFITAEIVLPNKLICF